MNNREAANAVFRSVSQSVRKLTEKGSGSRTGKLSSYATSSLAMLRRGAGKKVAECPDVWDITLGYLPDGDMSYYQLSCAENAIFTALVLFSIHQQGKTDSVSAENTSIGKAVRAICVPDDNESSIRKRFNAFATAATLDELAFHARGLVELIKKSGTLDYPNFAVDLFWHQISAESREQTRMRWGRDFYAGANQPDDNESNNQEVKSEQSIS
ncbi:MAG: type I-E CRISPR-associated protein Cse2/CasB [Eubacteriaceae bacterium]|nr:type I-E CRISPR-associated protein Cse2/CasB [Eubacteriaceae bacterium]